MNERTQEVGFKAVLSVNGTKQQVQCRDGGRRLSEVLRDDLTLTGTKLGCNSGDCGACTVLMDGLQVCSCLVSVAQADGKDVLTVEGIEKDPRFSGLQDVFVDSGAIQCGVCTPAMLIAAAEIVLDPTVRSRSAILDRLGGVLCRCTGYIKILEAIEQYLGLQAHVSLETPARGRAVGARVPKVDGAAKATGRTLFGADAVTEDVLHLKVIRSPHAHARFRIGDLAHLYAEYPGVHRVFTALDVPGRNAHGTVVRYGDQPVLADGYARYMGEAIAAVVGEKDVITAFDLAQFPVEWEPLEPLTGTTTALAPGARSLHADRPGNLLMKVSQIKGDVQGQAGTVSVGGSFVTSFVEHAYIEPEAGVARRIGDRIEIACPTQAPYLNRNEIAGILGISVENVRIIPTAVGGGFGGKIDMSVQPLIAVAAWHMTRPVACVYSRFESMRATTKRHPAAINATLTCDDLGRLRTYSMDANFNTGPYSSCGPIVANRVPIHAMGPYRFDAVRCIARAVHTTDPLAGAFRGFGVPQVAVAHEALMDQLADKTGIDRLEFRLLNAIRAGDQTATGQRLESSVGLTECLSTLKPIWDAQKADALDFNRHNSRMRRGVGLGCMWYGTGNTSQPNPSSMRIGLDREGRITLFSGAVDIGQGVNTILAQVCADALCVQTDAVHLVTGDTDRTLDAGKSSASRHAFISGAAVKLAAANLLREIRKRVQARGDAEVSFEGSNAIVLDGDRVVKLDLSSMREDQDGSVICGVGRFDPSTTDLDEDYQGIPYASYAFGAQMALVEVDTKLATVNVKKIWAAHDVGLALNPTQIEGQIHGGIAQGLGFALMEEYSPGKTDNLHDYLIPTVCDMPEIEVFIIEAAEPSDPHGAKGVGEAGLIPTAPAILNAVEFATGVRPTYLPLTPSRLSELLRTHG